MCLLSNTKKPLIAKEDIICYKVLQRLEDGSYISPFREVKYKINDFNFPEEESDMNMKSLTQYAPIYAIDSGFLHCLTSQGLLYLQKFVYASVLAKEFPFYLFVCYIPKGSKYFISHCGTEICADKLFVEDIKTRIE